MSDRNQEVIERVRELLDKYPELKSTQLHDMAIRMDTSLAELNPRSFHARYVLPIQRQRAFAEGRIRPRAKNERPAGKSAGQRAASEAAAPATDPVGHRGRRASAGRQLKESGVEHARVREILLRFTRAVAGAENRSDLVDLVGGIDGVVSEILGTPANPSGAEDGSP